MEEHSASEQIEKVLLNTTLNLLSDHCGDQQAGLQLHPYRLLL